MTMAKSMYAALANLTTNDPLDELMSGGLKKKKNPSKIMGFSRFNNELHIISERRIRRLV